MAELTTEAREKLPDSDFVFRADRSYPIQDLAHARNALSRVAENGTPDEQSKVRAAVYKRYPALKKSESVQVDVPIWKSDEHHLVYGVVLTPDLPDSQQDKISAGEIQKAAHGYLQESRKSDIQHSNQVADGVQLVESACAPHDMVIGGKPVMKGAWFTAHKITDPTIWERVSKADHPEPLTGLSMGGFGLRLPEESGVEAAMALDKAEGPEVDAALEKTDLFNVRTDFISLVDRAAVRDPSNPTQPQPFLLFKREGASLQTPQGGPMTTIDKSALSPEVREALEKAETDAATAAADLEKATKSAADEKAAREAAEQKLADVTEGDEPKPIDKAELPVAVREALEKAEAREAAAEGRIAKAEEKAESADKLAKAERDTRVTAQWITKAETGELRGLPGAPAEIGPVMKSLAEADPTSWATFEKSVLVPAVAQIREGELFKEQGRGGEGPPPGTAMKKFQDKVAELQKADSSLSPLAAKGRVLKEDPSLQREIAEEMGTHVA